MKKKIEKIIFCTPEYITEKNYGGLSIYIKKIKNLLNKKGIKTYIMVSSDRNQTIKDGKNIIFKIKVHNIFSKFLIFLNKIFFFFYQSYLINNKLNQLNKIHNFELVHFSNFEYISLLNKKTIPSICRLSSLEFLWNEDKDIGFINKVLRNFLEKTALKQVDLIISPSTYLKKKLKKEYGLKSKIVPQIIQNKKHVAIKNKKKYILTFGAISRGKGSKTIVSKINNILSLNKSISYIWIGNVDKKDEKSNVDFLKKLKLNTKYKSRAKTMPLMPHNRVMQYVKNSILVLLPSFRENSPNSCLEALSLGTPVVARADSGFDDLILNNKNGFLFKKNDENDMIRKIHYYLNLSKKNRKQMENYCIKSVEKFKSKNVAKIYLNIYNNLINSYK